MAKQNFLRFLRDKKGQEFSVFKLLISAVIAVVILGLLLSIINSIIITPQGDPGTVAGKAIAEIMRDNSRLSKENEVTFKRGGVINARGAAGETKGVIQDNEVCISAGEFSTNANWEVNDKQTLLSYNGSDDIKAKIVATCDNVAIMTDTSRYGSIDEYFSNNFGSSLSSEWFENCGCLDPSSGANRCCFVAVKRT